MVRLACFSCCLEGYIFVLIQEDPSLCSG